MAQVIKDITLEVSKPNIFQALVAKQCDSNSRYLNVTLVNEGKKIPIDSESAVAINTCRANSETNSFSGEVNDDGTALLPIHAWVLELPGLVKCDVSVMDSEDHKLTSTTFYINVEEAANEEGLINDDIWIERINAENERVEAEKKRVAAENERVIAEEARVAAENERKVIIDNTLSKEGYAAEAKVTGERIKTVQDNLDLQVFFLNLALQNYAKVTYIQSSDSDSDKKNKLGEFLTACDKKEKACCVYKVSGTSNDSIYFLSLDGFGFGGFALSGMNYNSTVSTDIGNFAKTDILRIAGNYADNNGTITCTSYSVDEYSAHIPYEPNTATTKYVDDGIKTAKDDLLAEDEEILASAKEYADELFNSIVNGDEVSY